MATYNLPKSYETLYSGSYGPLDPNYGPLFTGYRLQPSQLGMTTDPRTANVIGEVTTKLSQGLKTFEVGAISAQVFESIPKQHWKEVERIGKLTGVDFTMHAPIIDPAGFTKDGWNESYRQQAEHQFKNVIEKAHELSPKGNIPVTIHATGGVPSTEWMPIEGKPEKKIMYVVNRDTGQISPVEREDRFFPYYPEEKKEERLITTEDALRMRNHTDWDGHILPLIQYKKEADVLFKNAWPVIQPKWKEIKEKEARGEKVEIEPELQPFFNQFQMAQNYYSEIEKHLGVLYDRAYKYAPEDQKGKVREFIKQKSKIFEQLPRLQMTNPSKATAVYHDLIESLRVIPPETYVPAETFCLDKSKNTIANVALHAYKKFKNKSPIVSIENVFPNSVFGRAEELSHLIKESRKTFVDKAVKTGISHGEAERAAEKLIGTTWDVSHINMLRKYGFSKKDIVKETKKIAPFVKHVHLVDNFGAEHTELPPGMGEVPIKDMLKELEKKGYKGKKILEYSSWAEHFKVSPVPYSLEAMGSPLYANYMQPFWNQVRNVYGIPAGYPAGYGLMLPEQHFATYGTGFAALPMELGGSMQKRGESFTGTPMQ